MQGWPVSLYTGKATTGDVDAIGAKGQMLCYVDGETTTAG